MRNKLIYVAHGFDVERPRIDLIFRDEVRQNFFHKFHEQKKSAISLRFTIGEDIKEVIRELRRVADELEKNAY